MANDYYSRQSRTNQTAIYVLGRIEQFIADYSRSSQVSETELARRVAELLLSQTGGPVLGTEDSVSPLQRNGTGASIAVAAMEVARRPRGRAQVKQPHWTQLPENRKQMMKNIEAMRDNNPRTITKKQLTAMRRNAVKARASLAAKTRKQRIDLRRRQQRAAQIREAQA